MLNEAAYVQVAGMSIMLDSREILLASLFLREDGMRYVGECYMHFMLKCEVSI